jgi:hypothetical protein
MRKLTNTYKLTHENEHNTKETSYLDVEEFPTPHALSLYIFYLWWNGNSHNKILQIFTIPQPTQKNHPKHQTPNKKAS